MTKSALGKTVFKKAIRHENKIESLGKPAAKITGAGGIPAESTHYQKLPLYSEKGKARLTPPYAARKSPSTPSILAKTGYIKIIVNICRSKLLVVPDASPGKRY